jgi:hypothetical protein
VLARVAETSSIEHLCKIKVLSSIEVYGKNATLANTRPVSRKFKKNIVPYEIFFNFGLV